MHLPPGLYDLVLTNAVVRSLEGTFPMVGDARDLDADEAAERLAEILGAELRRILADAESTGMERLQKPGSPVYLADPADITGDRPMSITWTLRVPLPAKLLSEYSVLRG